MSGALGPLEGLFLRPYHVIRALALTWLVVRCLTRWQQIRHEGLKAFIMRASLSFTSWKLFDPCFQWEIHGNSMVLLWFQP